MLSIHHDLDINAGAPGATWQLAQAFRGLGHDVDILSFDDMPGSTKTKRYRFPWFVAREIVRRPKYDVYDLSSGDGWVASLWRRFMPRQAKSVIVARTHGLEHVMHHALIAEVKALGQALSWKYPIYHGGYRLWECRQSIAMADLALFLNKFDRAYAIERLGIEPQKAACVANGVAPYFVKQASATQRRPDVARPANVAFVGSHLERKGMRFLRDAMVPLMGQHSDVRLGFFGTGVEPAITRSLYPDYLQSRIRVIPQYGNSELPKLLEGFHILAFPSLSEGFPLVVLEAMSCGLVPVVFDIPGPTEIVEPERNGVVVSRADAPALRTGIERLLLEPARWNSLRREAGADVGKYQWQVIAANAVSLYSQSQAA